MITSLAYIVAPAYNHLDIVLMAFPAVEDATAHLTGLGMKAYEAAPDQFGTVAIDGETMHLNDALRLKTEAADALRKGLFKNAHYYGGCGECEWVEIREIPIGQPVVAFDLD